MTRAELEVLAEKYQARADRAYKNYHETGLSRYDRDRRNNEELADIARIAATAADDHNRLIHMRASLASLAAEAKRIPHTADDQKPAALEQLRKNILSTASLMGVHVVDE